MGQHRAYHFKAFTDGLKASGHVYDKRLVSYTGRRPAPIIMAAFKLSCSDYIMILLHLQWSKGDEC